jgi:predicted lipid-binding transport protein (Tim44 family)
MQESQLLDVVLIVVAGVVLFRLYTVLGKRTGNERTRDLFRLGRTQPSPNAGDNVIKLPDTAAKPEQARESSGGAIAQGVIELKAADKSFDADKFLAGAKSAYEIILTAFAKGDRDTLRPLLNDEVFHAFDGVVRGREDRKEKVQFTFVGFKDVKIVDAGVRGQSGEVTVSFAAQFISATQDSTGRVTDGDTKAVRDVTDIWTFARDIRSRDPNWVLVATSGDHS